MSPTKTLRQATAERGHNGTSPSAADEPAGKIRSIAARLIAEEGESVAHTRVIEAREAEYATLDKPMSDAVKSALRQMGIRRLFRHQADAINLSRSGRHVIVATPAASGKSLCYNLPVLHSLSRDPEARALYIFPTKALAHDQLLGLERMLESVVADVAIAAYDGDTPSENRSEIRRNARVILTNPDMLHRSTLPGGLRGWRRFLSNLKYVIVDEAHIYRGVFGSHVAMVLRRLQRICRELGTSPQYIFCSATISNPKDHAERLAGLPFHVVEQDGSPGGAKHVILCDSAAGSRPDQLTVTTVNSEAARYAARLVASGLRTMVFAPTRASADTICSSIRGLLRRQLGNSHKAVMPYRAGYDADYRESIERALKSGQLLCMVTTNAMELGIDIVSLDSTVLAGFPGTVASTWQQMWRSGRGVSESLSILIMRRRAVDQFYLRNPDQLFDAPFESARLSLTNRHVLEGQLLCAAHEVPLSRRDFNIFGRNTLTRTADVMVREGTLRQNPNRTRSPGPKGVASPAYNLDIRSIGAGTYRLVNDGTGRTLETVGEETAWRELYEGAVYMHKGDPHLVVNVDEQNLVARARKAPAEMYTTRPLVEKAVEKLTEARKRNVGTGNAAVTAAHGWLRVSRTLVGYDKVDRAGRKLDSVQAEAVRPRTMDTTGVWLCPTQASPLWRKPPALHAIEHTLLSALHISLMCDARDVAGFVDSSTAMPSIFIYDDRPGGIGLAPGSYEIAERLLARALRIISACGCQEGCPNCVISIHCDADIPDPVGAARLLNQILRSVKIDSAPERNR